jgi:hypothetical protein
MMRNPEAPAEEIRLRGAGIKHVGEDFGRTGYRAFYSFDKDTGLAL